MERFQTCSALIVHNSSGSQGTTVAGKASFSLTALRNRSPQRVAFLRKTTLGCSLLSFSLPRSLRCVSESKLNSLLLDFQTTEAGCFSLLAKGQGLTPNPAAGGEKCWASSLQAGSKESTPHQATAIGVFQVEQMIREGWEDGKMLPAPSQPPHLCQRRKGWLERNSKHPPADKSPDLLGMKEGVYLPVGHEGRG